MKRLFTMTLVLGFMAANANAYRLNDVANSGARWKSFPVNMDINPTDADVPADEVARVIKKSMENWNTHAGKTIFSSNNTNSNTDVSRAMESDGGNLIGFSKTFRADTKDGFDPSVVVAVGGQYGDGDSMSNPFIVFNSESVSWTTDKYKTRTGFYTDDLETIATHELGHVIGLGHSEKSAAIMSTERIKPVMTELDQDDIDGAKYLLSSSASAQNKSNGAGGCGYIANSNSGFGGGNGTSMMMLLFPILALAFARTRIQKERKSSI